MQTSIATFLLIITVWLLASSAATAQDSERLPGFKAETLLRHIQPPSGTEVRGWEDRQFSVKMILGRTAKIEDLAIEPVDVPWGTFTSQDDSLFSRAIVDGLKKISLEPAISSGRNAKGRISFHVRFYQIPPSNERLVSLWGIEGIPLEETGGAKDWDSTMAQWDPKEIQLNLAYPDVAVQKGLQGVAVLRVLVADHPAVPLRVELLRSDHVEFEEPAIRAVELTQFRPAHHDSSPVESWVDVEVPFSLGRTRSRLDTSMRIRRGDGTIVRSMPNSITDGEGMSDRELREVHEASLEVKVEKVAPARRLSVMKPGATWDADELRRNTIYPDAMRTSSIEGSVVLNVSVSEEGQVVKVVVQKSDNARLTEAAINAVRKTRFMPALRDQNPVASDVEVTVRFSAGR